MQPYPRTLLREEDITVHSIKPLTENYLQLSKKESAKERRYHWVRSVEEDREIIAAIDAEQSSTEEKLAFLSWLALQEEEVMNIDCSKWGLTTGRGWLGCEEDFQRWYITILEEMEVSSDGDKWAEEVEQLHLTLKRPFGSGVTIFQQKTNYTMHLSCKVVNKGPNYWVAEAENGLGKIYIPRNIIPRYFLPDSICFHVPPLTAEVVFLGFRDCRGGKMPWRAIFIDRRE